MTSSQDDALKTPDVDEALCLLGAHLHAWRKTQKRGTLTEIARKLDITRDTWLRMEQGNPGVRIETWLAALEVMGTLDEVVRSAEPDLFALRAKDYPGFGGDPVNPDNDLASSSEDSDDAIGLRPGR